MSLMWVVSAFTMGLFGSTHCALMCGGIVGIFSGGLVQIGKKTQASFGLQLAASAGRLTTYIAFGVALGALGSLFDTDGSLGLAQIGLRGIAGFLMVGVGLYLAGIWRKLGAIENLGSPLFRRVQPLLKRFVPVRTLPSAFVLGLVWGFMPCGLVYGALGLAVASGSAQSGGATMLAFGLGTVPMVLFVGAFARVVAKLGSEGWIRRVAGLAIVFFGIVNVATASTQIGIGEDGRPRACCPHPN